MRVKQSLSGTLVSALVVSVLSAGALAHDHGDTDHQHATMVDHGVVAHMPFVRLMPPMQPNTAAFMRLENRSENDRLLVSAHTDVAAVTELHNHAMVDGVAQMRQVQQIALPAGETVALQPGGLHIMMIGLHEPLQDGQHVEVLLRFDDGTEQTVTAPVRHPNDEMGGHHGHGHHGH